LEQTERRLTELNAAQGAPLSRVPALEAESVPSVALPPVPSPVAPAGKPAGSGPKYPTAKLSGFFHLDAGGFSQDAANRATLGDIQDGVGFRRARLQALGSVAECTNYSLEMDFATAGRPSFMDVWGEQTNLPIFGNVRIGHYRQPFSLDSLTSVRQLTFLERSLPFQAFVPFRRVGVMAYDKSDSEMTTWAYGIYRTGGFNNAPLGDTRFASDIGDDGGYSFSGRATHLLAYDEPSEGRYLLHIGGGYNYSRMTGSTANAPFYQARVIPEFFVGDPAAGGATASGTPFFLDTGRLAANQYHLFGAELAGQYGAFNWQGEYMATVVDQIGAPNVFYDGAYGQIGYFLTGENRTYNRTVGALDRVIPFNDFFSLDRNCPVVGWGAWEIAGRVSYVNLNDSNAVSTVVTAAPLPAVPNPGRMTSTTVGLNWFWNSYCKMQFNYIHCFLDQAVLGNSDCDIFCGRFETAF
jgi:phosphate-selective porin OprO/OprP